MAIKWEYRDTENYQQGDETKIQSMIRWLNANGREGWEFDQTIDFGDGGKSYLLFRRQTSS